MIALLILLVAGYAAYLQSKNALIPTLQLITTNTSNSNTTSAKSSVETIGGFVIAFIVYIFVLSLITPSEGLILTITLVLGALLYNTKHASATGTPNLLEEITKG